MSLSEGISESVNYKDGYIFQVLSSHLGSSPHIPEGSSSTQLSDPRKEHRCFHFARYFLGLWFVFSYLNLILCLPY